MNSKQRLQKALNHQQPDKIHNIQANVPVENVIAMIDAVKAFN